MRRHYRVMGELDGTGRLKQGTVTIDGDWFRVRPYRSTRFYELPFSEVNHMIFARLDKSGNSYEGELKVNSKTSQVTVMRPYELPLSVVATMVCKKVMIDRMVAKREAKKAAKKKR